MNSIKSLLIRFWIRIHHTLLFPKQIRLSELTNIEHVVLRFRTKIGMAYIIIIHSLHNFIQDIWRDFVILIEELLCSFYWDLSKVEPALCRLNTLPLRGCNWTNDSSHRSYSPLCSMKRTAFYTIHRKRPPQYLLLFFLFGCRHHCYLTMLIDHGRKTYFETSFEIFFSSFSYISELEGNLRNVIFRPVNFSLNVFASGISSRERWSTKPARYHQQTDIPSWPH